MSDSTEINALPSNGIQGQPQPQLQQMPQAQQVPPPGPQNQIEQGPPPAVETQSKEQLIAPQYNPNPNTEGLQNGPLQNGQQPPVASQQNQPQPQSQQPMNGNVPSTEPLSQEVVQQLIDGVQRAKETGSTRLQSRDIPQDQTQITIDQQQKPNHIAGQGLNEAPKQDYIRDMNTMETMLSERQRNANKEETLNQFYDEIQTPILIVVLFFIFQLPFVQQKVKLYLPGLFVEGKATLGAYILQALLFGGIYYGIRQVIKIMSG
jgi:hypothetical protein